MEHTFPALLQHVSNMTTNLSIYNMGLVQSFLSLDRVLLMPPSHKSDMVARVEGRLV